MTAETKYKEIMEVFNKDISDAIQKACDEIHGNIIPYINDDTEWNAMYRARDIVTAIIDGNFEVKDNNIVVSGWKTGLSASYHDKIVEKLAEKAGDKAKDLMIERLNNEIKELINDIYRR